MFGERPWIGRDETEAGCQERVRTVLRGASNLYFSVVQSALSIPEWDDPVHAVIAYYDGLERVQTYEDLELAMKFFERLASFSPDHVWQALLARRGVESTPPTPIGLRYEEFKALSAPSDPAQQAGRQFQTEHMPVPTTYAPYVRSLVVVHRLREVRALDGFTRIDSPPDILIEEDEYQEHVRQQALARDDPGWRPAVELLGEGVFFALEPDAVARWEASRALGARVSEMERAHTEWRRARELPDAPYPGTRFVLLHSLAHMLINALALECGYSSHVDSGTDLFQHRSRPSDGGRAALHGDARFGWKSRWACKPRRDVAIPTYNEQRASAVNVLFIRSTMWTCSTGIDGPFERRCMPRLFACLRDVVRTQQPLP